MDIGSKQDTLNSKKTKMKYQSVHATTPQTTKYREIRDKDKDFLTIFLQVKD